MLLSMKERTRKMQRPVTAIEESRYISVKRSMAGIKCVLSERRKIRNVLKKDEEVVDEAKEMI